MPKQDHSRDLLPHLDSKISAIRQQCYQLRADREFMQVRVYELVREVDALVRYFSRPPPPQEQKPPDGSDASGSPSPAAARRSSASLQSLDCLREAAPRGQGFLRSSLSIDDAILRLGIQETGPPPPRSLQSSPTARGHRKRVSPLEEGPRGRSCSYLKPDAARNRSDSQQSLPDSISRDAISSDAISGDSISRDAPAHRGLTVRAKSGDVRADSKMSLSSSSPALASKESPGHPQLSGQREGDRKDPHISLLVSKTCTDL